MNSLNENAWAALQNCLNKIESLGWGVGHTQQGVLCIDAGCLIPGSLEGGRCMADIGMAALAQVEVSLRDLGGVPWPFVEVRSNHPVEACWLSQAARWQVSYNNYRAMGSGPACLLCQGIKVGQEFGWQETCTHAVLVLEASSLPGDDVCLWLAEQCHVAPKDLAVIAAATNSLAGSAQIAARSVETALHKMHTSGMNVSNVVDAIGLCPVAPPAADAFTALGLTNDMMMFASQVWLAVKDTSSQELAEWAELIPAASSAQYGVPFLQALQAAGDFYNLDPNLFAPAEIVLTGLSDGSVLRGGRVNFEALQTILAKPI